MRIRYSVKFKLSLVPHTKYQWQFDFVFPCGFHNGLMRRPRKSLDLSSTILQSLPALHPTPLCSALTVALVLWKVGPRFFYIFCVHPNTQTVNFHPSCSKSSTLLLQLFFFYNKWPTLNGARFLSLPQSNGRTPTLVFSSSQPSIFFSRSQTPHSPSTWQQRTNDT